MPVRAVTSRFMYRGLCSIPDILSYTTPVSIPEDEVEGKWYFIVSSRETLSMAKCCQYFVIVDFRTMESALRQPLSTMKKLLVFTYTSIKNGRQIIGQKKYIFSFKFHCWFWDKRMNKRHQIKSIVLTQAYNLKGEGGRSYLIKHQYRRKFIEHFKICITFKMYW